jgi:hypothetical protein
MPAIGPAEIERLPFMPARGHETDTVATSADDDERAFDIFQPIPVLLHD